MQSFTNSIESTAEDEMIFINQIKKELSLPTTQDAVKLVAAVLQALRQTLTLQNAESMLNLLPDFLKLAFATNWERDEKTVPLQHLDEFVSLVMERDEQKGKGLFHDEVDALTVIVLTLKKLNKLVDLENFEGLNPILRQELRRVIPEAAID